MKKPGLYRAMLNTALLHISQDGDFSGAMEVVIRDWGNIAEEEDVAVVEGRLREIMAIIDGELL